MKKQEEKSWKQDETTDAIRNLAEFCLKHSLPEPIFQTKNLGKSKKMKLVKVVIAKVGKFDFVATGRLETATKDDAAIGLLNKLQKLEIEELDLIRTIKAKKSKKEIEKQIQQMPKQMQAQNSIKILEDYCLRNSLPKPVFQTKDHETIAKVGSLEAHGSGKLITAKRDAAFNLLTKLRGLETEIQVGRYF